MELAARWSLAFLWIVTALTSAFWGMEIGYEVLAKGGITGKLATLAIYSGSALDLVVGLWLLTGWRLKACYLIQLIVIISYSLLLTIIAPEFWLHPFGPLTKNIPILVMVFVLYRKDINQKATNH
ncbi:DoxX-like family protein [Parendozoicomonas haliclonae]|uniref:NAD-dependent dehydratase n=2 Tax=Parendozoicomonas haliclonae TaxID=1960125 RepID=A0A1X7AFT3_9GAMM|nr:hypothetical protein EHSB41UT_00741 [Parendozoicomonas haliclonae]